MKSLDRIGISDNNRFFNKPFLNVAADLALAFLINLVFLYLLLLLIPASSLAMIGMVWVVIIAWKGGAVAGILGAFTIYLSNFFALHLPPHNALPISYFVNGKVPGVAIGFIQTLVAGLIVGYVSTLVHKLRREISLRQKMQADLEQKVAELKSFGHTVAHDLKTPLTVIELAVTTLANQYAGYFNGKPKKMLTHIQTSTLDMINIIESLLVFAGIRVLDKKAFSTVSLSDCIEDALKRLEYYIEKEQVQIEKPDHWPSAFGYAPWITEVLVNYIGNAIKYGGNKKEGITPELKLGFDLPGTFKPQIPGQTRFWVSDNGDGIPEEKVYLLFREFSRLHTSAHDGHGLGLSIVKSVIDKLGGNVGFEQNERRGSRFYFTLPVEDHAVMR